MKYKDGIAFAFTTPPKVQPTKEEADRMHEEERRETMRQRFKEEDRV